MTRELHDLSPSRQRAERPSVFRAGFLAVSLVVVVWVQELADLLLFGGRLDYFGIQPRHPETFWHILTAPFLHAGLGHLIANTVPLAVLSFLSAARSALRFLGATLLIILVGGSLVWFIGRSSIHLGASELVFGYLGYLFGLGWWDRTFSSVLLALVAFVLYGGILWGVLPSNPMVSWEAHLFGFVGGLLAAMLLYKKVSSSPS